ncbi:glycoside hydrolase superfamily, partial [Mycena rosella]
MCNPKADRAWESLGPDPYLNGEGAFQTIMAVQSVGVQACANYLVANNQEHWCYGISALVDDRMMREMHSYPFLRSIEVRAPGVTSIMCSYNQLNGTSLCHNAGLLGPNGLVRSAGFQGAFFPSLRTIRLDSIDRTSYVVSDWGAPGATHDSIADNSNAGLDVEQPGDWILIGGGVHG